MDKEKSSQHRERCSCSQHERPPSALDPQVHWSASQPVLTAVVISPGSTCPSLGGSPPVTTLSNIETEGMPPRGWQVLRESSESPRQRQGPYLLHP